MQLPFSSKRFPASTRVGACKFMANHLRRWWCGRRRWGWIESSRRKQANFHKGWRTRKEYGFVFSGLSPGIAHIRSHKFIQRRGVRRVCAGFRNWFDFKMSLNWIFSVVDKTFEIEFYGQIRRELLPPLVSLANQPFPCPPILIPLGTCSRIFKTVNHFTHLPFFSPLRNNQNRVTKVRTGPAAQRVSPASREHPDCRDCPVRLDSPVDSRA